MNVLFLSLVRFDNLNERGIYVDLIRKFTREGHNLSIVFPSERRYKEKTGLSIIDGVTVVKFRSLNIQKTGNIEKGLAMMVLDKLFLNSVKKFFGNVSFDLILYTTPPITFTRSISFVKKRDNAITYLLLKDIFPQNAVDLGLIRKGGLLHRYFRAKEKLLYQISDFIGCMSPANVNFLLDHNSFLDHNKVDVNPNSLEPEEKRITASERESIRRSNGIPLNSVVFIYGGNLGKPQGISFLIDIIISNKKRLDIFFLIIGDGTEYYTIKSAIDAENIRNVRLMQQVPKLDYEKILLASDVGLIFLDNRFTIPNYPSRLLSYLEARKPVIAATDLATDLGSIMEDNGYGLWVPSGDLKRFNEFLNELGTNKTTRLQMGEKGFKFFKEKYHVNISFQKIIENCSV